MVRVQKMSERIFRRADIQDVVFIARLLREFYSRVGHIYRIPFNYESTLSTVDEVVRRGVCLVGPTSCAGATISAFPWNNEAEIACVVFWYFQDKHEIKIFECADGCL